MISGIFHVIRNGLRWKDAPSAHGPQRPSATVSVAGPGRVCPYVSLPLRRQSGQAMVCSSLMRRTSGRTALLPSCCRKGGHGCLGRTRGRLNSRLHAVCNAGGKPLILLLTEEQLSDCKAASALLEHLPPGSSPSLPTKPVIAIACAMPCGRKGSASPERKEYVTLGGDSSRWLVLV